MKKSMRKTAFALCVALSVFMCKPAFAFAAVCGPSPDKVHHFDAHQRESGEFGQTGGYHSYLYGYSAQGQPLYKNDCRLTFIYKHCNRGCKYCGTKQDNSRHTHQESVRHSIDHR